ncbi:MAG: hypothetical protein WCJ30_13110, partial [Deltaproteobacteria bacterium]
VRYLAQGKLDYGNSPRATPLIQDGRVFLLGAMGHLNCVDLVTGKVVWEQHIGRYYGRVDKGKWGYASSPLIVGGWLIVNPGAKDASLVAREPATAVEVAAGGATARGALWSYTAGMNLTQRSPTRAVLHQHAARGRAVAAAADGRDAGRDRRAEGARGADARALIGRRTAG